MGLFSLLSNASNAALGTPLHLIREARLSDAEALGRVELASWRRAYQGQISERILGRLSWSQMTAHWIMKILCYGEASPRRVWVLEHEGIIKGYAQTGPARGGSSGSELIEIYLVPEVWGRGLGGSLFQWLLDDLEAREERSLDIWVLKHNRRARGFYERFGFSTDDVLQTRKFRGMNLELVCYTRSLLPN